MDGVDFPLRTVLSLSAFLSVLVVFHAVRSIATQTPFLVIVSTQSVGAALVIVMMWYSGHSVGIKFVLFYALIYGVCCYLLIAELMLRGGARWLNLRMGSKWIKRIDYVYLGLGGIGALLALNRIESVHDRVAGIDLLAPLLVMTAIAIRLIKTRAELNDWDRL